MSSVTDRERVDSSEVDSKALDRYIHAVTICNSLALLVSQGSLKDFAVRIALLTTLQKCWLNGHSVLQLVCSSDGAIDFVSSVVVHGSSTSVVSGSRVDVTEDVNSFDIKSSEPCNDSSAGEAWLDCTVVSQSEYLNTFNGMDEKSVVAAHETMKLQEKLQCPPDGATPSEASDSVEESSPIVGRSLYSVCDICCRRFANAESLAKHLKCRHKIEPLGIRGNDSAPCDNSTASSTGADGSDDRRPRAQLVCTACGRQFRLRQLLAAHSVTHTGARPAPCRVPGCDKRFGQTSTRNYHERTHSDARPYVCSRCGQSYKQPAILKTHVATVHGSGARPHRCPQCGKAFKLNGALQTHVRTVHGDNRPHSCAECAQRFNYRSQLSRHVRALHANERPWPCSVCDRTFAQPGNLQTHMRRHTGEKPYSCTVCGQSFAHSGTLKRHKATHRRPDKHTHDDSRTDSGVLPAFAADQSVMSVPFQQLLPL